MTTKGKQSKATSCPFPSNMIAKLSTAQQNKDQIQKTLNKSNTKQIMTKSQFEVSLITKLSKSATRGTQLVPN